MDPGMDPGDYDGIYGRKKGAKNCIVFLKWATSQPVER